jgi:hypothetical protein
LKPAYEPIVLARKPFKGSVATNVEKHGTGALWIESCRIEGNKPDTTRGAGGQNGRYGPIGAQGRIVDDGRGRWPANVVMDDLAALVLDEQSGELRAGENPQGLQGIPRNTYGTYSGFERDEREVFDSGGASRFFYVAKPSREERDYGCEHLSAKSGGEATRRTDGSAGLNSPRAGSGRTGGARNYHPTVKPVELMRWLIRLITPPNGVVLDPFLGSGTTGMATKYEWCDFIGIEREEQYLRIAEARIRAVAPLFNEASA